MTPSPPPASSPPPWRRWTSLSIKAGVVIAALTMLAQWTMRSSPDKAAPTLAATRALADPVTTGAIGPRAPLPATKPSLDQQGLASLVSQAQGGAPAKPAIQKKR
jgi:hypothetical protein